MGILAYQLGIFIAIQVASLFGKSSRNTAAVLIAIFTIIQVYTSGLMALQFITIIVSYLISDSLFFTKKSKSKQKQPEKINIVRYNEVEPYGATSLRTENKVVKNNNSEKIQLWKEQLAMEQNNAKKELLEHLEFSLSGLRNDLKNQESRNISNSFTVAKEKIANGLNQFKVNSNPLSAPMNFEKYIILHKMILDKLNHAEKEYKTKNITIDMDSFIAELMVSFHNKTKSYNLNIEDHRIL